MGRLHEFAVAEDDATVTFVVRNAELTREAER
jgi:hypothetical protein